MKTDYVVTDHHLLLTIRGHFSVAETCAAVTESARLLTDHGLDRLLLDWRDDQVQFPSLGVYEVHSEHMPTQRFPSSVRMAAVTSPRVEREDRQFIEDTARNAGFVYKVFTDMDEAKAWLLN